MDKYPYKIRSGSHKTVHACRFLHYYALTACGQPIIHGAGQTTDMPVTCKRCLKRMEKGDGNDAEQNQHPKI